MVWVLLVVTGVLAVMVGVLARRVHRLEQRLEPRRSSSSDAKVRSEQPADGTFATFDASRAVTTEFVITRVGEPEPEPEAAEPVPTVPAPVFADLLLKETVVQTASLFQGLRRALAPETRNRIRFHMRQEVKRSRKQRRAEIREARREWAARQRAAMAAEQRAEGSAA
ncbi:MAG TPA: hypothetical protein VFV89_10650 [Nocardioides sp.]|uniref:hypothetical protein n=1 Tax=Nocardioides sp. TaxID=35761 RepID=UPI002E320837|nr:hypothetical protein [Nocardioides sp.]HEX5088256.1 hypothetical protein [Nocardioides sp.]